jgi:homoserine kinase
MRKVTVRLPASITSIGPGIRALGLAIGIHTTVEISERSDNQLIVDTAGEGAGHYSIGLRHPVVLALMRVFQRLERAPLGIHVRINNLIPVESGLGAEAAFWVAGIIGAHNLLGHNLSREEILRLSAQLTPQPDNAISTLLGGLTSGIMVNNEVVYRSLPLTPLQLIIVLPELESYVARTAANPTIALATVAHNISRIPLLLEGLRAGDLRLITQVLDDQIDQPRLQPQIPGYTHVLESARIAGASGMTICGSGPALMAFAPRNHQHIADAMVNAFANLDIKARAWVAPIDTQGVVISAMQSS